MEHMIDEEVSEAMPATGNFYYLIEILTRAGTTSNAGGNVSGLSWLEIVAFLSLVRLPMTIWETQTIKAMSDQYASSCRLYDNSNIGKPYSKSDDKKELAQSIKSAFKAMGK